MTRKRARQTHSTRDLEKNEQVRRLVYTALDRLGTDPARFRVSVGKGVVSVRGQVPNAFNLGPLAESIRSIPQVKEFNAHLEVMSNR